MATTQKVAAIRKRLGTPKGEWLGSGRVKGWGRWTEGAEVTAEVTEYWVCRFCHASSLNNESHRFVNGQRYSKQCSSSSWRRRTQKTGRVLVQWHHGERIDNHDIDEEFTKLTAALVESGFSVEREGNELIVSGDAR